MGGCIFQLQGMRLADYVQLSAPSESTSKIHVAGGEAFLTVTTQSRAPRWAGVRIHWSYCTV